jgi:hypothetical protein
MSSRKTKSLLADLALFQIQMIRCWSSLMGRTSRREVSYTMPSGGSASCGLRQEISRRQRNLLSRSPQWQADWEFGTDTTHGDTFICDFYVVKKLTVPIILGQTLLYGTNAFAAGPEHFRRTDEPNPSTTLQDDHAGVATVQRVSRAIAWLRDAWKSFRNNVTGSKDTTGMVTIRRFHLHC